MEGGMAYRAAYIDNSNSGGIACRLTKPEHAALSDAELLALAQNEILKGEFFDKIEDGDDESGGKKYRNATIEEMMAKVVITDDWPE
jgi:hypothetical protein